MKLRIAALVAIAIALGAAVAFAAPGQSLGINAGLSTPVGDWTDVAGTGFHFGGNYCYRATSQFGLGVDLNYHMLGEKSASGSFDGVLVSAKLRTSVLQAGVAGKLFLPVNGAKTEPYFRVGLGLYNVGQKATVSATDGINSVSESVNASESKFGFNVGVGVDITTSDKAAIGIEALYHMIPMSNDTQLAAASNSSGNAAAFNKFTVGLSYNFLMPK